MITDIQYEYIETTLEVRKERLNLKDVIHDYLYSALRRLQYAKYKMSAVSLTRSPSSNILICSSVCKCKKLLWKFIAF